MITAKAFATCLFAAAQTYQVPQSVILGISNVEGGRIGQVVHNVDLSDNLGPMQINTVWIPEVSKYWKISEDKAVQEVRDDPCINVGVGAWILRKEINETGSLESGIEKFHKVNPDSLKISDEVYKDKVLSYIKNHKLDMQVSNGAYEDKVLSAVDKAEINKNQKNSSSTQVNSEPADSTASSSVDKEKQKEEDSSPSTIFFSTLLLTLVVVFLGRKPIQMLFFKKYICTKCGTVGYPKSIDNSNFFTGLLTIILLFCFVIPGLICMVWQLSGRKKICPVCRSVDIIPVDTPIGRTMLDKIDRI